MDRLLQQMNSQAGGGGGMAAPRDQPMMDTAETVHISSLALLKVRRDGSIALPG